MSNQPEDDNIVWGEVPPEEIDIMANRNRFKKIEPDLPKFVAASGYQLSANDDVSRHQRKELLSLVSNAGISFSDTSEFFEFLNDCQTWIETGAVPGTSTETGPAGAETGAGVDPVPREGSGV